MTPSAKKFVVSTAFVAVSLLAPLAHALDAGEMQTRMVAASSKLAELETREFKDEAAQDIASARLSITEIQTSLNAEMFGKAEVALFTLEARLLLIESIIDRAVVDDLATKRESDNINIQTQADEMQLELETTSTRREQLQQQVQTIVNAMEQGEAPAGSGNRR